MDIHLCVRIFSRCSISILLFVCCFHFSPLPKWMQIIVWVVALASGFFLLINRFFRNHWLEIFFWSLAIIYLLTVVFVPENLNNNFASTLKEFIFIVGIPLLPYRIKDAIKKINIG